MKATLTAALALFLISVCPLTRADFKYSEQSQMTGGSLAKMTHALGVFSKSARQANQPTTTTTMVKGNRMRTESSDGKVQVIDLDGRRFIYIDPAVRQYSIVTFDDFKAAMQRAEQQAEAQRAQQQAQAAQTTPQAQQNPNVKITPKFDAQVTGASRNILGVTANEMKMKMEMLVESTDPKTQGQSGSFLITSDSWMAPSVPGYDELHAFQLKLAKELDWFPGTFGGLMGANMSSPQMGSAMEEFRKNAAKVQGVPLSQVVSVGMASNGAPSDQNASNSQSQNPPPQQQTSNDNSVPTTKSAAVMKGLGGLWGKRKKQQQDQQQDSSQDSSQNSAASTSSSQTSSTDGTQTSVLMEVTSEVTSFSSDSLDSELFGPPSGYTQVQGNADSALGGRH